MPKISIIVPVYNVEQYLRGCMDSLVSQTLQEIEVICVDDASTDHSGQILDEYKGRDARITVIHLRQNEGTLNARIAGVHKAQGAYLMFVDSDDYIEKDACQKLYALIEDRRADVVHFGTVLHPDRNVSDQMQRWVETFLIPFAGEISGMRLVDACFMDERFDFNITNKIWSGEVCRKAFAKISRKRLVASEDRYLFFLLAFFSRKYYGTLEKYYHYNLGIGITGGDRLTIEQFDKRCLGVGAVELVEKFLAEENVWDSYRAVVRRFTDKILYDCVDCWEHKLRPEDRREGFVILCKHFKRFAIVRAILRGLLTHFI